MDKIDIFKETTQEKVKIETQKQQITKETIKQLEERERQKHATAKLAKEWRELPRRSKFIIWIMIATGVSALIAVGSTNINFINWIQLLAPWTLHNTFKLDEFGMWANINNIFSVLIFYGMLFVSVPLYVMLVSKWDIMEKKAYDILFEVVLDKANVDDAEDIKADVWRKIAANEWYKDYQSKKYFWSERHIKALIARLYAKYMTHALQIVDKMKENAAKTTKSVEESLKSVSETQKSDLEHEDSAAPSVTKEVV